MELKSNIKAIFFDVFGTVVNWHESIVNESKDFAIRNCLEFDQISFADRWRSGFRSLQARVANNQREYLSMDDIHMEVLDELLGDLGIPGISEEEKLYFNRSWHRLSPWEDSVQGLHSLKETHVVSSLSNGNLSMLVALSKNSKLPWDCILSTEFFGTYKPDPRVYLGATGLMGMRPEETLMVAAHAYDLDAARFTGMKTCYVRRPNEFGAGKGDIHGDLSRFDIVTDSILEIQKYL